MSEVRAKIVLQRAFVEIGGQLFEVVRVLSEASRPNVTAWKEALGCTHSFKHASDGNVYFCKLVEEAVVLETIPYTQEETN